MTGKASDARFEEGGEAPLVLAALDGEDLRVLSALIQDAVFPITEMTLRRSAHRFAVLLNRFRWEDREAAEQAGRAYERVQSMLVIEHVLGVKTQGIDRGAKDTVLSLMSIGFELGPDGTGKLELVLAGDGSVAIEVEALEVTLTDVTRPYVAPSRQAPGHPE